jgi:hypothetical protein
VADLQPVHSTESIANLQCGDDITDEQSDTNVKKDITNEIVSNSSFSMGNCGHKICIELLPWACDPGKNTSILLPSLPINVF